MMKSCAMIVLLLLAASLSEAARIFDFESFHLSSNSQVKVTTAGSYQSVEERILHKEMLELNERFSNRDILEKHPGSETNLRPKVFAKSKASDQPSKELVHTILPSLKFSVVEPGMEKHASSFQPLGHSPGIGHENPPGLRH